MPAVTAHAIEPNAVLLRQRFHITSCLFCHRPWKNHINGIMAYAVFRQGQSCIFIIQLFL